MSSLRRAAATAAMAPYTMLALTLRRWESVLRTPPSQITLGRNTSVEAQELKEQGLGLGQYHTDTPDSRPVLGVRNAMLELQVNAYLPQSQFGKTWLRKITKVGSCQHYWGPAHDRKEVCMCSGVCRECLAVLAELPHKGFHHACRSLIVSIRKPSKKADSAKRKYQYDPRTPVNPEMAVYIPSGSMLKRQKLLQLLKEKQLRREADESAESARREAAQQQAEEDQESADLEEFEMNTDFVDMEEEIELSAADREAQDRAIEEMEVSMDAAIVDIDIMDDDI